MTTASRTIAPASLSRQRLAGADLPLKLALFIGFCDSVVAFSTSALIRPSAAGLVIGAGWIVAWATALVRSEAVGREGRRRPWLLPAVVAAAMLPAILDGGYPGNLATQPVWLVLVAAAVLGRRWTLATGIAAFGAKCLVFGLTSTGPEPFAQGSPDEALTAVLLPLMLVPFGLAMTSVLEPVTRALADPGPPPATPVAQPTALTPAQVQIVDLLASGLSPKQISAERGTSLETVRTQIKWAKRKTGSRTLEELVARSWRPR